MPSMIGKIKPYHIKYKSLKSKFKIDPDTFRILPTEDSYEKSSKNKSKRIDPNRLSIELPPNSSYHSRRAAELAKAENSEEELMSLMLGL